VRKQPSESNPLRIRPARADEAEAIAVLIHRAFEQYRGKLQPESGALSENAETVAAAVAGGTTLVAMRGERMVGCVSVQRKGDFAYAGRLAVDPLDRGTGVGCALMAEAAALTRRLGLGRLRVDTRLALTENRAFFKALGFVEGAHRCHPGFTHPTYVELEKTLI
jgi:N-acetylglutamate synthase-like GNAT family acetyltransferase